MLLSPEAPAGSFKAWCNKSCVGGMLPSSEVVCLVWFWLLHKQFSCWFLARLSWKGRLRLHLFLFLLQTLCKKHLVSFSLLILQSFFVSVHKSSHLLWMLLNVPPKCALLKRLLICRGYLSTLAAAVILILKHSLLKHSMFSYYPWNKLYKALLGHILLS